MGYRTGGGPPSRPPLPGVSPKMDFVSSPQLRSVLAHPQHRLSVPDVLTGASISSATHDGVAQCAAGQSCFVPSGMMAPLSDLAWASCSGVTSAPSRLALLRSASLKSAISMGRGCTFTSIPPPV